MYAGGPLGVDGFQTHTNDVYYRLTAWRFGPFKVLEVRGAQAILDLPPSFGKTRNQINLSW